jgi:hypothetical protein
LFNDFGEGEIMLTLSQSAKEQVACQYRPIWLRDNGFRTEFTHSLRQKRLAITLAITADIAPDFVKIEGHQLVIKWCQEQHLRHCSSSGAAQ